MTQIHWSKQINGAFTNAADWTGGAAPGTADDAILDAAGTTAYTVTTSASETVSSIQTAATATLAITGGEFTATNGTGAGGNAGSITLADGADFAIGGAFANTGKIALGSLGDATTLAIAATTTLSGAGKVTLSDIPSNQIVGGSSATTLTNAGNLISGAGTIGSATLTLVNQAAGVIEATGANALIINTGANAVTNAGYLETKGAGGLTVESAVTNTGKLYGAGAGALAIQSAVVTNTGGVVEALAGGHVSLQGGSITGGSVVVSAGGLLSVDGGGATIASALSAGTLTNAGSITVNDDQALTLQGTIANSGVITIHTLGNQTSLIVGSSGLVLNGAGKVTLTDNAGNQLIGTTGNATLTNVGNVISGAGQLGGGAMGLVNDGAGVIDATGINALILDTGAGADTNAGLIEATGAGGLTILNSTVDNQTVNGVVGVVSAGTGSKVSLQGATIVGGILKTAGTGAFTVAAGSTLNGATSFGAVNIEGQVNVADDQTLSVEGAIANPGTVTLGSVGDATRLAIAGTTTLSGAGKVTLSDNPGNQIVGGTSATTLTNAGNLISGAGTIGSSTLTLVNQAAGIIEATGTNALIINTGANAVTNAGYFEAKGAGGLTVQSAVTNTGKLFGVSGGALAIQSAVVTNTGGVTEALAGGHVSLQGGSITGGSVVVAAGGLLSVDGGGATIASALSAGSLTNAGSITVNDDQALTLQGPVANSGVITIHTLGDQTSLIVGSGGLVLNGAGKVTLTDNPGNQVIGASAKATLTNVGNVISGAGQLGGGAMGLVNEGAGVIDATGTNALILDTGAGGDANAGLIEATGAGGLTILNSTVDNETIGGVAGVISAGTGSSVSLQGATIAGGILKTTGTGAITVATASTLNGATSFGAVNNQGQVNVADDQTLSVEGAINNTGTLTLASLGDSTTLAIAATTTLSGAGRVTLDDTAANVVTGVSATTTLTNLNNTISGAGQLGAGKLTLVNQAAAVIDATGTNALVLNTGSAIVANTGLIEATGAGGLTILGTTVDNQTVGAVVGSISAGTGSVVTLQGATIAGGTLTTAGTGAFTAVAGATLNGATAFGAVKIQGPVNIGDTQTLNLEGAIIDAGTISVNSLGDATTLAITGNTTLSGGGNVVLDDSAANQIVGGASATTLTNAGNLISGAGTIGLNAMTGTNTLTLVNQTAGFIDASGAANPLILDTVGKVATNAGLIETTGAGGLTIASALTNTSLVEALGSGALTVRNATVTNAAGGSVSVAKASHLSLQGGAIAGGTVTVAVGGLLTADSGGATSVSSLAAATLSNSGAITIDDQENLTLQGAATNSGVITVNTAGNETSLTVGSGGLTLSGGGGLALTDSTANEVLGASAAATLTNVDNTISGAGQLGAGKMTLVNQAKGVIDATGANPLILDTGTGAVTNAGLIEATNPGNLSAPGGLTIQSSKINNAGGAILASGATVRLAGADILGGTLETAGASVIQTADATSVLDGSTSAGAVSNQGSVAIADNTALTLTGAVVNNGTVALNSAGDTTSLTITGATTLGGRGSVTLDDSTANRIIGGAAAATLTNGDVILGAGTIGSATLTVVNQSAGVIDATGANALVLDTGANTLTNAGVIEAGNPGKLATTGGLTIQSTTVNNAGGLISANGGNVNLQSATIVGGTLRTAGSNVIQTVDAGSVLNGVTNLGTVNVTAGTALTLKGAITNTGAIDVLSTGGITSLLIDNAGATITGAGAIVLNPGDFIYGSRSTTTLTNDSLIEGSGNIGDSALTVDNQSGGVINANATNVMTLYTGAGTVNNAGLIEATGAGGLLILNSTVNGAGVISANGGDVTLQSADIVGGVLQTNGSNVFKTGDSGSELKGVDVLGTVDVVDGDGLILDGAITVGGILALQSTNDATKLTIGPDGAILGGGGAISLSDNANNAIVGGATASTLTNGAFVHGDGTIGGGPLTLVNQAAGIINSDGAVALTINTGANTVTNAGVIEAVGGGGVAIKSNVANTGNLEAGAQSTLSLAHIAVANGPGGEISALDGGTVGLTSVSIAGGTLTTAGTGVIETLDSDSGLDGTASQVTNAGMFKVSDTDTLAIQGAINNSGTIDLAGSTGPTQLNVSGYVALTGGGNIVLSDNHNNKITGDGLDIFSTLINVNNRISGAGEITGNAGDGENSMVLINQAFGVIDGTSASLPLTLDTGDDVILNAGLIESTNGNTGGVVIDSPVDNRGGTLEADAGGSLSLQQSVTTDGSVIIKGGEVYFAAPNINCAVNFIGVGGELGLVNSQTFVGKVAGFSAGGGTTFDLRDVGFVSATEATYVDNGSATGGVLTVTDGTHTAHITLVGNYTGSTWTASGDGDVGVIVATKSAGASAPTHAHFLSVMASLGATPAGPVQAVADNHAAGHAILAAPAMLHAA